ncbi:hypothetical protein [Mycoplasma nasistruthionis]|uniref:hypothetical protein n=1 Tax=Mycoplasma nasistruthionis TaxID=353852 RepID=UPI001C554ADF|nr:hypothetical protein [Mycoplasma nasistruthionis]
MLFRTADLKEKYLKDVQKGILDTWLLKILFWTSLCQFSKLRSFYGSDKRFYKNEFSLDTTLGETLTTKALEKLEFNQAENKILGVWMQILIEAKKTENYNPEFNYGLYQIIQELNTFKKEKVSGSVKNVYDYPELNSHINTLKQLLKDYFLEEISPNLFKYEFLK